jgi:hypothetical protein
MYRIMIVPWCVVPEEGGCFSMASLRNQRIFWIMIKHQIVSYVIISVVEIRLILTYLKTETEFGIRNFVLLNKNRPMC